MRVGIITSLSFPPQEGIGHFVTNLAHSLIGNGHTVYVFTRGKGFKTELQRINGLDIYKLPYIPVYPFHVYFHGLFLRNFIQKFKPTLDVLDFQSPLVPVVNNIGIPYIATVHTFMVPAGQKIEMVGASSLIIKIASYTVSRSIEEALFSQAPIICTVRPIEKSELTCYRRKPKRIVPVGVGVHDSFLEPIDSATKSHPPYVFYAGRLDYNKGLLNLVESIKYVVKERSDVKYVLAGDGKLRPVLEKAAALAGVSQHIEFIGAVNDRAVMRRLHQKAAVYMQPSSYEGIPASILEAMASGTPIVYTDTPGARSLISPDEGILTPPNQPQKLAEAILEIISDYKRLCQMGQACREKVLSNYTWEIVGRRIMGCYDEVIVNKESRLNKCAPFILTINWAFPSL